MVSTSKAPPYAKLSSTVTSLAKQFLIAFTVIVLLTVSPSFATTGLATLLDVTASTDGDQVAAMLSLTVIALILIVLLPRRSFVAMVPEKVRFNFTA